MYKTGRFSAFVHPPWERRSLRLLYPASPPGKGTPSTSAAPGLPGRALASRPWPSSFFVSSCAKGSRGQLLPALLARLALPLVQAEGGSSVSLTWAYGLPPRSPGPGPERAARPPAGGGVPSSPPTSDAGFRGKADEGWKRLGRGCPHSSQPEPGPGVGKGCPPRLFPAGWRLPGQCGS